VEVEKQWFETLLEDGIAVVGHEDVPCSIDTAIEEHLARHIEGAEDEVLVRLDEILFDGTCCGDESVDQFMLDEKADCLSDARGDHVAGEGEEDLRLLFSHQRDDLFCARKIARLDASMKVGIEELVEVELLFKIVAFNLWVVVDVGSCLYLTVLSIGIIVLFHGNHQFFCKKGLALALLEKKYVFMILACARVTSCGGMLPAF
jgi:hypothetical protein